MEGRHEQLAERALVLACQLGDETAFERLFVSYHAKILYYVRGIVGTADAEDVLQKTWLTVYRKIDALKRPEAFRPWLYRIARNTAISHSRKQRNDVPLQLAPTHSNLVVDPEAEKDDEFSGADLESLVAAMGELSPLHREIVVLRYVQEMSYQEIAEVVAAPVGTVRSRLHYSKKALRRALEEPDEDRQRRTDDRAWRGNEN